MFPESDFPLNNKILLERVLRFRGLRKVSIVRAQNQQAGVLVHPKRRDQTLITPQDGNDLLRGAVPKF